MLAVLAALAVGLAVFYYFTGEASTLPLREVPHLQAIPLALDSVAVGAARLPVQASGFVVSLTHDVAGPFTQPLAAGLFLALLAVVLVGWVAVLSDSSRKITGTMPTTKGVRASVLTTATQPTNTTASSPEKWLPPAAA